MCGIEKQNLKYKGYRLIIISIKRKTPVCVVKYQYYDLTIYFEVSYYRTISYYIIVSFRIIFLLLCTTTCIKPRCVPTTLLLYWYYRGTQLLSPNFVCLVYNKKKMTYICKKKDEKKNARGNNDNNNKNKHPLFILCFRLFCRFF